MTNRVQHGYVIYDIWHNVLRSKEETWHPVAVAQDADAAVEVILPQTDRCLTLDWTNNHQKTVHNETNKLMTTDQLLSPHQTVVRETAAKTFDL